MKRHVCLPLMHALCFYSLTYISGDNIMKIFILITIFLTSVLLFGCTKSIDEDQLLKRNGIAYEINSDKPFTGKVTSSSNILGMKSETYYRDGFEHGTQTAWHKNGNKGIEMEMFNGKPHGRFIAWFENGQKRLQMAFKNGKKHNTEIEWDKDGQKKLQKEYRRGKLHGTYLKWYKNGTKQLEVDYELGVMHGNWIAWYENSQKKEHRGYVNGLRHAADFKRVVA
jgi:antitoxin component YwqK of YwqJK toxin-antitoxin module